MAKSNFRRLIALDLRLSAHLADGSLCRPRENLREAAHPGRRGALHDAEAHPRVERQMFEQIRERIQPTRRRAEADDGEISYPPEAD